VQNQASPVEILSPTIPSNWCPTGSWSDVFNNYQTLFLNNSTVNIPGLGLVTPDQIATINQNIQNLQNEYAALAVNVRSGSIASPATGARTQTVTFSSAMPTSNYIINIVFVNDGTGTSAPAAYWSLGTGSKTTTGFSFNTNIAAADKIISLDWTVQSITSS